MKKLVLDLWYRYVAAPLWQRKRRRIFERDGGCCFYCREDLTDKKFTVDHVIPRSKGGSNRLRNLVACCKYCNKLKGDSTVTEELREYMAMRAFERSRCYAARARRGELV